MRLPLRLRLTLAFAVTMAVMLAAAATVVYERLASDYDQQVTTGLRARARAALHLRDDSRRTLAASGIGGFVESRESFAQLYEPAGRPLAMVGGARTRALSRATIARAARGRILVERTVAGIDGTARILAQPLATPRGRRVVALGRSLDDRDEALSGVVRSFAVGGAAAVALASLLGYALATLALRPLEAIRHRARALALSSDQLLVPLPRTRDEIRRLGETLNEMLQRMRGAYDRERRFVADASHELRTPIAVVKTELEGALRSGDYGPQVREALVAAAEECDNLAQLADDLLVLARAAEGALPLRRERIDAAAALDAARARFAERARARGRRIVVDAVPLAIAADRLRLDQALDNLVDNALRHGRGTITLQARGDGPFAELLVADEGAGFADELGAAAFERFTRGERARAREGAGLGLAIVRTIAEAHGGQALAAAGPPARVLLRLPLASPDLAEGRTADRRCGASSRR